LQLICLALHINVGLGTEHFIEQAGGKKHFIFMHSIRYVIITKKVCSLCHKITNNIESIIHKKLGSLIFNQHSIGND
jgi:hypothetical protein